jgi:hydrogenase maturation protease
MKIILIGLGNPILGDDGVGWKVAEEISKQDFYKSTVEVDYLAVGGLALMERLVGYDRAILVDSIQTGLHPPGTVILTRLKDFPEPIVGYMTSAHDVSLHAALKLGRELGFQLPDQIDIIGIETMRTYEVSEELSPIICAAVPHAMQFTREFLQPLIE